MAVHPADLPSAPESDDSIDLGYYFRVLARWWKEILLIALLTAVVAGIGAWLMNVRGDPVYAAASDIAIVRTVSEFNFDERFTTTSETPSAAALTMRRNALAALAVNPALAIDVIAELGDALPAALRNPSQLARQISAALASGNARSNDSDLIRITALADTPELAAQIATAWGRAFVRNTNAVYGQAPNEMLESMTSEQQLAQETFDRAQDALQGAVAESRVDELSRRIDDTQTIVDGLQRGRKDTFDALVDSSVTAVSSVASSLSQARASAAAAPALAEQQGKQQLLQAYIGAIYANQNKVFTEQTQRDQELLTGYYTRWLQVTRSLEEAKALRAQAAAGGQEASGSDALVLSLLKLQAFTQSLDPQDGQHLDLQARPQSSVSASATEDNAAAAAPGVVQSSQPVQVQVGATPLQIQLDDKAKVSKEALLGEVDALVSTLTQRKTELESQISTLSEKMLDGAAYTVPDASQAAQSALAAAVRAEAPAILAQNVVSGTEPAGAVTGLSLGADALSGLYHLDDLQKLASELTENDSLDATIEGLEQDLRTLKASLEAEKTKLAQLTQARDLARDALATVGNKIAELTLSRAAASSEVRFAAPGVPPLTPEEGPSPLLFAAAGFILGLMLGVAVAFIADFLGKPPFLSRRRAPAAGSSA